MKTITKLFLAMACVCLLIACSKSDDETLTTNKQLKSGNPGSGTEIWEAYADWSVTQDVYCHEVMVDQLVTSNFTVKMMDHYVKGDYEWSKFYGENMIFESNYTGEIFTANLIQRIRVKHDKSYVKMNLLGNMGTHYNLTVYYNDNFDIVGMKSTCN